ncbi:MAG: CsbD family protein [bacterium]|nr:CsbD family protein [bacterium]
MDTPTQQQIKGTWKQFRGKLQEKWGELTDDDLDRLEGKRDQIEGFIEKKTGEARQAVRDAIDEAAKEVKYTL